MPAEQVNHEVDPSKWGDVAKDPTKFEHDERKAEVMAYAGHGNMLQAETDKEDEENPSKRWRLSKPDSKKQIETANRRMETAGRLYDLDHGVDLPRELEPDTRESNVNKAREMAYTGKDWADEAAKRKVYADEKEDSSIPYLFEARARDTAEEFFDQGARNYDYSSNKNHERAKEIINERTKDKTRDDEPDTYVKSVEKARAMAEAADTHATWAANDRIAGDDGSASSSEWVANKAAERAGREYDEHNQASTAS
jgi:hypothetical protein